MIEIPDDLSALTKVIDVDYSIPTSLAIVMPLYYNDRSLTDKGKPTLSPGVTYNKQTGRVTVDVNALYDWTSIEEKQIFKFTLTRRGDTVITANFYLEISCKCCAEAKWRSVNTMIEDTESISRYIPSNKKIPDSCQFGLKVTKEGDSSSIEMTDKLT